MKASTKTIPIKKAIKNLHQNTRLSDSELADLKASIQKHHTQDKVIVTNKVATSIATIACMLFIGVTLWVFKPQAHFTNNKTDAIIRDVVDNHLLHKQLTYRTSSITELNTNFSYLGFLLSSHNKHSQQYGQLIGARPCFILNIPAAQLRYEKNNRWITVFQTRYEEDIYGHIPHKYDQSQPFVSTQRGVKVNLWQENGLLFAVAQAERH